jgi:hypothetical protein
LRTDERIAINDHAFALSAHLTQRTTRVFPEYWTPDNPERFVVIAAKPRDRSGSGDIAPEWRTLLARAVAKGAHRYLVESPGLVVLERTTVGLPANMGPAPSP